MAFAHGKQVRVHIGHQHNNGAGSGDNYAYDVSSYLREATTANPVDTAETSAFGSTAKTYVIGQYGTTLTARGMFEDTDLVGLDAIVNPMLGVEEAQAMAIYPTGYTNTSLAATSARRAIAGLGYVSTYDVSGSVGDMVAASLNLQGTGNVRSGPLLTDPRTLLTATGAGSSWGGTDSYDMGASWSVDTLPTLMFLFMTANTASTGSIVIKIQSSATRTSGHADVAGLTTGTINAGNDAGSGTTNAVGTSCKVIVPTAGTTINRYVHASWVVTGTPAAGTGYKFAVILARQG